MSSFRSMPISSPVQRIPASTSSSRDYAKRRKDPAGGMNRLYTVESSPTTTGMKAEHRLGLRASEVPAFAAALAAAVGVAGAECSAVCVDRRAAEVSGRTGQGSEGQQRQKRRASGPLSGRIGRGARAGDQPGSRQRRQDGGGFVGARDPAAERSERRFQESRRRSQCGQGRLARHSER